MSIWLKIIAFLPLSLPLISQNPVAGVINQYTKVVAIDPCEGKLAVTSSAFFNVGDKVLLMQMKGAVINESNSGSFGNITEIGNAGNFEKCEIKGISGNSIFIKNTLVYQYNVNGAVQLISLPQYQNALVTDTLKAVPWNGMTGGVVALEVSKTLTLNAPVNVCGMGFRGADINVLASDCTWLTNADAYHYSLSNWRGAPKGEGIAAIITGKEQGKGAQANGGGGGNDHNSGGGGGGNIAGGGGGGKESAPGFGCDGNHPGVGGKANPNETKRIYPGGGGGAGHVNNAGAGSAGGNGGGIVIIIADTIKSNGFAILANGLTPLLATGDGGGGGGAGGTILLDVKKVTGNLEIEANGGKGGDVINDPDRCYGPGGGGSGGRLVTALTSLNMVSLEGGIPGVNTISSGQCNGASNGAAVGEHGFQTNFTAISKSNTPIIPATVISQPVPASGCAGFQTSFEFIVQGNYLNYQWQMNNGSGWTNVPANATYSGTLTSILTIFNPTTAMNGYQFRCVVSSICITNLTSQPALLTMIALPSPSFSFASIDNNGTIQFTNTSTGGNSYLWDFGDSSTSTEEHPLHIYAGFGQHTVTLTVTSDCGTFMISQNVQVSMTPVAHFTMDTASGCAPLKVKFSNQSSLNADSIKWFFPGGSPASSISNNPVVTYSTPGSYAVTLIASNDQGHDTLTIPQVITVNGLPQAAFMTNVNNLTIQFVNMSSNASGGFLWDFGDDSTSTQVSPVHTFTEEGFFEVTLTAFNQCGEASFTVLVSTGTFPFAAFTADFEGGCAPMTVNFSNQSSGTDLTSIFWEFEGGVPATSTEPNPAVTYSTPGIFDVKLTVGNAVGEHSTFKENYVVAEASPEANFSFIVSELTVSFNNESSAGTNFVWDFGDGNTSTGFNPIHTYANGGVYYVMLTASNLSCGSAIAHQIFLDFTATGEEANAPSIMVFPNPAKDIVNIKLSEFPDKATEARLFDLTGKLCNSTVLKDASTGLDVASLPAGIYILEVRGEDWQVKFKVVKM